MILSLAFCPFHFISFLSRSFPFPFMEHSLVLVSCFRAIASAIGHMLIAHLLDSFLILLHFL